MGKYSGDETVEESLWESLDSTFTTTLFFGTGGFWDQDVVLGSNSRHTSYESMTLTQGYRGLLSLALRLKLIHENTFQLFLKAKIIGRLECGRTQLEESEELGITQSVISRLWQRFQEDGNVSRCYSTGRPQVTTPNEDRYLAVTSNRNRRSTSSHLSRQLSSATGTTVSMQTVYRRSGHIGLYARRSIRCVPLSATHCRLRLTWSREHALWIPQQWYCVMFSDEPRFSLMSNSRRTLIWRAPGTRYHQENTIERHRYGGAEWLVWRGIILVSRTDLHVQSVTMTDHIYLDVILEQRVCLFRGAMGVEFLFMDDNVRPHRANIVDECL
ncbi:transposable element Tcb1 transposase [Trichonephila clavipes]|nr:transposable element Tcb1 transposase [Trichonephila clavipes]